MLNKQSGLKGMAGVNDFRELEQHRAAGDNAAQLAFEVYVHRLKHYLGAYLALLGRLDVLSFTAGVGENNPAITIAVVPTNEELAIAQQTAALLEPRSDSYPSRPSPRMYRPASVVTSWPGASGRPEYAEKQVQLGTTSILRSLRCRGPAAGVRPAWAGPTALVLATQDGLHWHRRWSHCEFRTHASGLPWFWLY